MTKERQMDDATCNECGKPLGSSGAHGLCPVCLMRLAMATRTLDTVPGHADAPPPPPVEEIAGRFPNYEVVECLGRGGMGVVYKARQKSLDRWVAIKVLAPERVNDERFAEHFEREAKTLARMSHPNIVTVYDHGQSDGMFYIVMEFIDGVNLRDLMRGGEMEPEQALAIVPPICEALEYAHDKGVVHRDIKPENLLLDKDGRVKIADFGIASLVGAGGEATGTPAYMAPEQKEGTIDRRADIYALGVVLYEMLTGERPQDDVVAPSRRVAVDVRIDEMVLRALEKEPERRYQTAGEFCTVVQTVVAPDPGPVKPPVVRPAAGVVKQPVAEPAREEDRREGNVILRRISVLLSFIVCLGIMVIILSLKIIPRWQESLSDQNTEPATLHQWVFGLTHFIQRIWPVLALLLVLLLAVSVILYVVAASRGNAHRKTTAVVPALPAAGPSRLSVMAVVAALLVTLSLFIVIISI